MKRFGKWLFGGILVLFVSGVVGRWSDLHAAASDFASRQRNKNSLPGLALKWKWSLTLMQFHTSKQVRLMMRSGRLAIFMRVIDYGRWSSCDA